jgi:hypothetical protein
MGSRAIKHGAIDIGAIVGRRDLEGVQATGPKGCEVNPCVKRSRRPWDCWSLSDLEQVDYRSLATLNAKLYFLCLGG